jgi:hypothetical protein
MKYFIFLIVFLISCCELCPAQSHYPFASPPKTLTTAVDTITATTRPNEAYELTITNYSSTDTVAWRTDLTTTWNYIMPRESDHRVKIFLSKLFRKVLSGTASSEAYGN